MKIRVLASLLCFLSLTMVSCTKSHEQEIVDWYEEARAVMGDRVSSPEGCNRHRRDFYLMLGQSISLTNELRAASAEMRRTKERAHPSAHRQLDEASAELGRAFAEAHTNLNESFLRQVGWNYDDLSYCSARFGAEEDPSLCNHLLLPAEGFKDYMRYAYAEYCIENRIPPYDFP